MIQVFIFHGWGYDGQDACNRASAKANNFLQEHEATLQNPQISTTFTSHFYNGTLDSGTYSACTVTVVANCVEQIVLPEEQQEDDPEHVDSHPFGDQSELDTAWF